MSTFAGEQTKSQQEGEAVEFNQVSPDIDEHPSWIKTVHPPSIAIGDPKEVMVTIKRNISK